MPGKKKTLFVSDIHLGAEKGNWDWFKGSGKEGKHLINFFEYVTKRSEERQDIKEVVLLGDIFDLWVCPHDEVPHTFDEIIIAQEAVIGAIKKMATAVRTIYINGNHDYQVKKEDISKAFEDKVIHYGDRCYTYRRGNILAEHGHRHALFNRPDPKHGGITLRLPLGYYITRLHTTLESNRSDKAKFVLEVLDEVLQAMFTDEKIPESLLDTLRDTIETGAKPGVAAKKVDSFKMGNICADQSYDAVKERYRNLIDDWTKSVGSSQTFQMIMCEMNRLGTVADQLCRDGVDIVVFGHSHDTKMDKDAWLVKDRIYANCGYWCGYGEAGTMEDNAHFVETDGETVILNAFKEDGQVEEKKVLTL